MGKLLTRVLQSLCSLTSPPVVNPSSETFSPNLQQPNSNVQHLLFTSLPHQSNDHILQTCINVWKPEALCCSHYQCAELVDSISETASRVLLWAVKLSVERRANVVQHYPRSCTCGYPQLYYVFTRLQPMLQLVLHVNCTHASSHHLQEEFHMVIISNYSTDNF